MSAAYVVPAARPLTVLHRADPDARPGVAADGDPIRGWTVCELPMCASELWVPVERREGDTVCRACEAPGRAAQDVQEALL